MAPERARHGPLVHVVGYARALELCATARFVGAREASELGLATAVVRRSELDAAAQDLVAALLATPPDALRTLKPLLANAIHASADEQLAAERAAQAGLLRGLARRAGR